MEEWLKWLAEEALKGSVSSMKITSLNFTSEDGVLRVEAQCQMPVMLEQIHICLSVK